jgi:hypothetical protein
MVEAVKEEVSLNDQALKQEQSISANGYLERELETLIDLVWNDLQGQVSRAAIQQVLLEIIPEYENATVTTFVPIFIRRDAVDTLRARLAPTGVDFVTEGRSLPQRTRVGRSPRGLQKLYHAWNRFWYNFGN